MFQSNLGLCPQRLHTFKSLPAHTAHPLEIARSSHQIFREAHFILTNVCGAIPLMSYCKGGLYFWMAGTESNVGSVAQAHNGILHGLDWHPLGHLLATSSASDNFDLIIFFWLARGL